MRLRLLLLPALALLARPALADDQDEVKADSLAGTVSVEGIDGAGAIVGDGVSSLASTYDARGTVRVTAKHGEVNKIETYVDWTAPGGVHAHVWERLWVSGDTYTGWSERQIYAANANFFSREVIDGSIKQRIHSDGSGKIEWTVGDGATSDDSSDDEDSDATPTPTPKPLPTVEVDEEGSFQGSFFRRIEIKARGGGRASIRFTDKGYERSTVGDSDQLLTVQEDVRLSGTGKGGLEYNPKSSPTPTPTPSPTATPTPTPDDSGD